MSYRTIRKQYQRLDHGNTVLFKLYNKDHKVMKKATKRATAKLMKQCVWRRWDAYDNHYDRPCYVPEYASEDKKTWNTGWDVITERNNPIEENVFYTHNDILKIAKDFFEHYKHDYTENGIMSPEELADITFEGIDWQSPDTYMTELTY